MFVILQITIAMFVRSKEEEELDLVREMRLAKNRQRLLEAEEIKQGRLETAVECMKVRDLL